MYFEAQNIYKQWPCRTIDCSFAIEKSSILAIVGPSGSGKSTILRIIAGLEKSDAQKQNKNTKIILDGKDITNLAPQKRNCGMVFQSPALFLHMSVTDNIAYGLVSHGLSKRKAREESLLALKNMNLLYLAERLPETLSGGEAQRVSLLRTLILKPKLVLLDEPLSALDAPLRKKLAVEIRDNFASYSQTAVLVTHDISEAKTMAENIILLDDGKITWQGKAKDFEL